jgi:hypothetical protein
MLGILKLAAVSAVLSAGLVAADGISAAREIGPVPAKTYTDRVPASGVLAEPVQVAYAGVTPGDRRAADVATTGKGDSQREKPAKSCEAQTWPNIARHCIASSDAEPRRLIRTITIESRDGATTSVLTRVSAATVAQR